MNDATNDLSTMVYVQQGDSLPPLSPVIFLPSVEDGDGTESMQLSPALDALLNSLSSCGTEAESLLEEQLEALQDAFLHKLESTLRQGGVILNDKLTITLTENQTLVFQSHEDNSDELLAALGGCEELQTMFVTLHKLALMSQGLHFMNHAYSPALPPANLPQYRMCLKGALSHFYLR